MKRLFDPWLVLGLVAAAAIPAAYTLDPCLDHDAWWHMATGRWIEANQTVPWTDPFSQGGEGKRWYAYSWLFDIYLFEAFDRLEYRGIMAARTLLTAASTATVFAFLIRRWPSRWAILLAVPLGVVLMMFAKERPWHITIIFTTLTLWAMQSMREGWPVWKGFGLILMFAIWANVHIQFVYGWLPLGLACMFPGKANRKQMIALTVACIAATMMNPYTFGLYEVIVEYATQSAPRELINELAPPEWDSLSTWATLVLIAVGFVSVLRCRPVDLFSIVLLLIASIFALRMRRDIWFGAVAAISCLRVATVRPQSKGIALLRSRLIERSNTLRTITIVAVVAVTFVAIRGINDAGYGPRTDFKSAQSLRYPQNNLCLDIGLIVNVFSHHGGFIIGEEMRIFNDLDWGGFLIWDDFQNMFGDPPSFPVCIDGRTNLYGDEKLRRNFATWNAEGDWEHDPDLMAANIVIAQKHKPLTQRLRERPADWLILHDDDTAVVFGRLRR